MIILVYNHTLGYGIINIITTIIIINELKRLLVEQDRKAERNQVSLQKLEASTLELRNEKANRNSVML